ncbi:MAG TPA: tetratricopeptide repeat protein [Chthonomonadaceae bacterium]|nr:tetratricopeptide repeat protein [Chthonomonadaceae bacterium]
MRQKVLTTRAQKAQSSQSQADAAATAKIETGIADLEKRVAADPKKVSLRQALLLLYQQTGRPDKATDQLAEIVRLQPKDPNALLALANARLALKQWPQAESAYRDFTRRWPKSPSGWQGLAATLFHEGRYREAALTAREALKRKPEDMSSRYIMAASLLEDVLQYSEPMLHSEELTLAKAEFEKLIKASPNTGDFYYRLGRVCMTLKDSSNAIKNMEQAARLLPDRADVALYLARAYTSARNSQAARTVLEAAVAKHPDSAELNDALGQLIQASGEPGADQKALALFQKAVQLDPRAARFAERLGTAYLRTNDLQHAREAFETAARLSPNRAFPYQQLAAIYTRQGDPKRATAAAREAEMLDFNAQQFNTLQAVAKRHPENVKLRLALADRYLYLGMRGPARDEYTAILQLDKNNPRARAGLAALDKQAAAPQTASTGAPTPTAPIARP